MATCKDCIHHDACAMSATYFGDKTSSEKFSSYELRNNIEESCDNFQNKARFIEVRDGHNVGDICIYGFDKKNKSLSIVKLIRLLDDESGLAEIKFLKVIVDDTGNGLFEYLLNSGKTMNASLKYLKNITPVRSEDGG